MKIEIPKYIETGSWECNYSFKRLVNQIVDWMSEYGLEMNPDFQRGHVWTEDQQIKYIEAILSGGAKNARVIYLNNPNWMRHHNREYTDFVCVDGLQRFTAIKMFIEGKIKPYGYTYEEIESSSNVRMSHDMKINVNDLPSKKDVLIWYLEMNEGGTPHSEHEISKVRQLLAKVL